MMKILCTILLILLSVFLIGCKDNSSNDAILADPILADPVAKSDDSVDESIKENITQEQLSPEKEESDDENETISDDLEEDSTENINETEEDIVDLKNESAKNLDDEVIDLTNNSNEVNEIPEEPVVNKTIVPNETIRLVFEDELKHIKPKTLIIKKGETVRFINELDYMSKSAEVSVYAYLGDFRSPRLKYGEYMDYTFDEIGEVRFSTTPYTALFGAGKVIIR